MSGYPPYDGFTAVAIIVAIILSAIVSLIGTAARKRNISLGEARVTDLAEMTGIRDARQILDTFGPPDMGRVWRTVTLFQVRQARQPGGWLMSSDLVDYGCILMALVALFLSHPLVNLGLFCALLIQIAGWVVASGLPK